MATFRPRPRDRLRQDKEATRLPAMFQDSSPTIPNILRRKRSVIGDHVRRNRETTPDEGPGKLSIRIPKQNVGYISAPAQQLDLSYRQKIPISVVPSTQGIVPYKVLEEPHHIYYAPTPMSELSATSSFRDKSPSIFSQISPSSTNTPATSVTGYSPQVIQSPQFGAPCPVLSPTARSQARDHRSKTSILRQPTRHVTQDQRSTTTQREASAKIVRPPELAHLETANTAPVIRGPPTRPERPSEGLTALPAYLSPTTRDLRELNLHGLRGQSRPAEPTAQLKPFAKPARAVEVGDRRQMSQSQPSVARTRLSIKPPERPSLVDTTISPDSADLQSRSSSAPASAVSTKLSSRFGFLHRKEKIPVATRDADDLMQARKGPTAGTGHEGYGRQASKRRSSGGTSSKRGSSGGGSSDSGDDFLVRKAAPVYLRKGDDGQLVQSDRNSTGFEGDRTSQKSLGPSYEAYKPSMQQADIASSTQSLLPLQGSQFVSKSINTRESSTRGRGGSGSDTTTRFLNKAEDRKRGRTPENDQSPPVSRLPTPFAGSLPGPVSSLALAGKAGASAVRSLFGISSSKTKTNSKRIELPVPTSLVSTKVSMKGSSNIALSVQPSKTMAHYEILGNKDNTLKSYEHVEMEEIGQILEEAVLTDTENAPDAGEPVKYASPVAAPVSSTRTKPVEFAECSLTLAPELQRQHSKRSHHDAAAHTVTSLTCSPPTSTSRSGNKRQSRLPQAANHARNNPNQKSFSRPFEGLNSPTSGVSREPPLPSSWGPKDAQMHKYRHFSSSNTVSTHSLTHAQAHHTVKGSDSRSPDDITSEAPAFLKMPTRKDSDVSVSSSSGSLSFWCPINPETASLPRPGSHASPDEVWQEYDDFIEKVLTPSEPQPLTHSPKTTKGSDYFSEKPRAFAKIDNLKAKSSTPFPQLSGMAASVGTKLSPFAGIEKRAPDFRGQQHPALATVQPPIRPLPETPALASQVSSASQLIRRTSVKTKKQAKEPSIDKLNTLDLREAALEVSKWMSFDQVLVSPAHGELQTARDEKILVIDGLGDEWSLFCAKNYPNTQVFDISPTPYGHGPNSSTSRQSKRRHVRSSNLAVSFPYPANTFHTVVFRFPAATSEFSLGCAISECKRVLSPGGFLEICVMDLDLDIMGPRTRRAVKGLKERLQDKHPDVSLKPTSDYVQYLLGRYGLENLNRVMIGVPVAGVISSSPDRSKDEGVVMKSQQVPKSSLAKRNEIFRTLAPKVARWWYTQTYEQKLLANNKDSKSIWTDRGLLKECRDKQAAFRLLICHAQKPVLNKRKTQSL